MNCKQSDVAIVVSGVNAGRIVRCVRYYSGPWSGRAACDGWELDVLVLRSDGRGSQKYLADYRLRPLRDNGGEDETLTWAGKPKEVIHESSTTR